MTFDAANGNVFVLIQKKAVITVINGSDDVILKNITLESSNVPTSILFIPSSDSLYTAWLQSSNITVMNASNLSFSKNITLPGALISSMIYDPANGYAYIASLDSNIFIVNAKNNTYLTYIPVGSGPFSMVLVASTNTVFDYNEISSSISEISQLEPAKTFASFPTVEIYGAVAAAFVVTVAVGGYIYFKKKH